MRRPLQLFAAMAVALLASVGALLVLPIGSAQGAITVPSGFTQPQVVVNTAPACSKWCLTTDMEFAPDGRLFVAEKAGKLLIAKPGKKWVTFLNISAKVDDSRERGLQALTFDPSFSKNHYVYLYYTMKKTGNTPAHNRLVRVTAKGDKAVPGSEKLLLRLPNLKTGRHMGGSLEFGKDGKLYVSVGENNQRQPAQVLNTPLGKILRINKDGTIPRDNPFYSKTKGNNRAIWARGFRNPWKITVQPGTSTIFVNDVGGGAWEEINRLKKGANYGWPKHEGPSKDPPFVSPLFAYKHTAKGEAAGLCCVITGGAFYKPATVQFPKQYVGDYFFSDNAGGWIKVLDPPAKKATTFATGITSPRDLEVKKDGSLYVLGVSRVEKISHPR